MAHLIWRLTATGLRRRPGPALALALALAASTLTPALIAAGWDVEMVPASGVLLAAVFAFAAGVGAVGLTEQRDRVLAINGAPRHLHYLLSGTSMAAPAMAATGMVLAARPLLHPAPAVTVVVGMSLVIPVLVAPAALWVATRAAPGGGASVAGPASQSRRARRMVWLATFALIVLVVVAAPGLLLLLPTASLVLGPLRVLTRADGGSLRARLVSGGLALGALAICVVFVGTARDWLDLFVVLLVLVPVAVAAVAVLGIVVADALARAGARIGGIVRLALAPVVNRRAVLGPVVGLVAAMVWLAVVNAVVGASFDERERARPAALAGLSVPAGNRPDQAIVWPGLVDPAELRSGLARAGGGDLRSVVIGQVGIGMDTGTTGLLPRMAQLSVALESLDGPAAGRWSSSWVGVVSDDDLPALGWDGAAEELAAGRAVLVGGQAVPADGTVRFRTPDGPVSLPASSVASAGGGAMPGALVSEAVAATLSPVRITGRVVVVPQAGHEATDQELLAQGNAVVELAQSMPLETLDGLSDAEDDGFEFFKAWANINPSEVVLGDQEVEVIPAGGPLNEVPIFAGTREQGRARLVALAGLPLVMTVAGVALVLSSTRRQDAVLAVQGAPRALRAKAAAIQGLLLGGSASVVAASLGIGVPALTFAVYNSSADLPPIPLVVPAEVLVVLVALPVLAAAASAMVMMARRSDPLASPSVDYLAW